VYFQKLLPLLKTGIFVYEIFTCLFIYGKLVSKIFKMSNMGQNKNLFNHPKVFINLFNMWYFVSQNQQQKSLIQNFHEKNNVI
jgi:hypothetical protein